MAASAKSRRACGPSFVFLASARSCDALKSPRNDTGIDMTNLHRSPPMNQSETDLGIVNESQLLRFGIRAKVPCHPCLAMSVHRGWSQPVDATLYLKEKRWSVPAEPRRRSERRRAVLNQISWLALIAKNHGSHFFNDDESFNCMFRRSSFAEP